MPIDAALMWFRRDLRVADNAALHAALTGARRVHCVFVFDTDILDALPSRRDRRVEFIHGSVTALDTALRALGGGLVVLHGRARELVPRLARDLGVGAVYANHDYEPATRARDATVGSALADAGIAFHTRKDQVIFERDEVLTGDGRPFSVYTPYRNAWLKRLATDEAFWLKPWPVERYLDRLAPEADPPWLPGLDAIGFEPAGLAALGIVPGEDGARARVEDFRTRIAHYGEARDYPAVKGPSYLSVHLRFGTVSIRELARLARAAPGEGAATWLGELVWRDFYHMILHHHPRVDGHAFRPALDALPYPGGDDAFEAWREARTGYPIVDAAMLQLARTGYMHNRLRMIVASFLVKDLHVDWRRGERHFADHLNDFDLAANNGGWQWAASTGCDAQPWFRIFNPVTQSARFDAEGKFIRRYLPVLARVDARHIHAPWTMDAAEQARCGVVIGRDYPAPVVDHATARKVTLELYGRGAREGG